MTEDGKIVLDPYYWNYSKTTLRYLKQFLGIKFSKTEMQKKIDSGELVYIYNLSEFCRKNSLGVGHMSSVFSGKRPHHRGWRKAPI